MLLYFVTEIYTVDYIRLSQKPHRQKIDSYYALVRVKLHAGHSAIACS